MATEVCRLAEEREVPPSLLWTWAEVHGPALLALALLALALSAGLDPCSPVQTKSADSHLDRKSLEMRAELNGCRPGSSRSHHPPPRHTGRRRPAQHNEVITMSATSTTTVDYLSMLSAVRPQTQACLAGECEPTAQLSALDAAKHDFVAAVSHELRTPLTSILGYLEALLDGCGGDLTSLQHSMVQRADSNARRLLKLIENLLTLADIEAGTIRLERRRVDLVDVVSDSLARAVPSFKAGGLKLTLDLGAAPAPVICDEVQLGRVVSRILDNVISFSHPGGQVLVTLHPDGDEMVLEIADTGIGIATADQAHLFERFVRAPDARRREVQGLGLGLTVVGSIVAAHGGRVSLSSTEGVGTVVTVRLPRAAGEPSLTAPGASVGDPGPMAQTPVT